MPVGRHLFVNRDALGESIGSGARGTSVQKINMLEVEIFLFSGLRFAGKFCPGHHRSTRG